MSHREEHAYVLGTGDDELARLGFQHRVWAEHAFALWDRAGFARGHSILDLGCGPGYATLDLAAIVGSAGRVLAIDNSERYLQHLRSACEATRVGHVETKLADVHQMSLAPTSLDGAYVRWVLCFVEDPAKVVQQVAAALKPGGVFAITDYLNYRALALAPRSAVMERVARAVAESWRLRGGDCDIVIRLPEMLRSAGLELRDVRPITRAARPGSALWGWPEIFFRIYIPVLVEIGLLTAEDEAEFHADWNAASNNPAAFFLTPTVCDLIAVKPS